MRNYSLTPLRAAFRRSGKLALIGLFVVTGCLPYSCQRQPSDALYPSDSLSREVAQKTPADTLTRVWTTRETSEFALKHPRTVRFFAEGRIAVSDVEQNSLFVYGGDGKGLRTISDDAFAVPYLIGTRRDTLLVFNAETNRIDVVTEGRRLPAKSITYDRPAPEALTYLLATDTAMYAKSIQRDGASYIARLDASGAPEARAPLPGPYWRYAGFLRAWGDTLVSLSGYRPVVDLLPRGFQDGTHPDSLALVGFDSPMLARSYAFAQGDVSKAPLLTPAAAPVGDTLFVLNLRPGWVQIDVYDRNGQLQRRLIERHEGGNPKFYPLDLDAQRTTDGYRFAVTIRSPEPRLEVFRWTPSEGQAASRAGVD